VVSSRYEGSQTFSLKRSARKGDDITDCRTGPRELTQGGKSAFLFQWTTFRGSRMLSFALGATPFYEHVWEIGRERGSLTLSAVNLSLAA
jgi:hypothetical protein